MCPSTESQSARASSQVSAAADDAIQPRERSSATETKRDAAKCREDDVRCGGGRGGVVVISHTVLRIQPEARQARLRRPTRDHLPARTLTKAQTQNALDAASEQSEVLDASPAPHRHENTVLAAAVCCDEIQLCKGRIGCRQ